MGNMMTNKDERLAEKLLPEIEEFKQQKQTLELATIDAQGKPNVSYAPFAMGYAGFYILVSDMARHGMNLKANQDVSVMLVEDEAAAKSVFARKRLTFDAKASLITREDSEFATGVACLVKRFGEMSENLSALADFNLYRLVPHKGLYVKGFGQAFSLSGAELMDLDWKRQGQHGVAAKA
jgi:heme utilization protein HutZ